MKVRETPGTGHIGDQAYHLDAARESPFAVCANIARTLKGKVILVKSPNII